MKKFLGLALFATLVVCASSTSAQVKLGYINSQELIAVMPEKDSAQVKIEAFSKELQDQMESIQVELNNKFQKYQKESATYGEAVRAQKEKELQDLSERIQEFRDAATQDLQNMNQQLMTPVFTKADEAIKKVAAANAFTAIFDTAGGALLYFDTKTMVDILPLVKTELNITK